MRMTSEVHFDRAFYDQGSLKIGHIPPTLIDANGLSLTVTVASIDQDNIPRVFPQLSAAMEFHQIPSSTPYVMHTPLGSETPTTTPKLLSSPHQFDWETEEESGVVYAYTLQAAIESLVFEDIWPTPTSFAERARVFGGGRLVIKHKGVEVARLPHYATANHE